ncbi:MAG TPA: TolC family protein, partial [Rhodocyclaceae bacterium]|nr:TolC family protein [Rhodocyclaceae bacterium]
MLRLILAAALVLTAAGVAAQDAAPTVRMPVVVDQAPPDFGRELPPLLQWARQHNPDFAAMRFESDAAQARVQPAQALPDPMLLTELRDVTREAEGGGFSLDPSRVGSTRWQVSQALPGWGKRGRREGAASAAAEESGFRAAVAWNEVAAQLRSFWTQSWRFGQSLVVTRELKELMRSVEETARRRYGAGLGQQQDVLRAQVELSVLDGELAQMEAELHAQQARLNSLLARDPDARLAVPEVLPALPVVDHARHLQLAARLKEKNPLRLAEGARADAAERNREVVRDARTPDYRLGLGAIQ